MSQILFPNIINLIKNDADNYVSSMTSADLCARQVSSHQEYIDKSLLDFNIDVNTREKCIQNILTHIALSDHLLSFISDKFITIPWSIVFFTGTNYENGLPHTRFNTIFLPVHICFAVRSLRSSKKELIRTLIHEKIHVFQKLFPTDAVMKSFMSSYKIITNKYFLFPPLVRANPDTDDFVYKNVHTNEIICFLYRSTCPTDIGDVINLSSTEKYEHPFEIMAYTYAESLTQYLH